MRKTYGLKRFSLQPIKFLVVMRLRTFIKNVKFWDEVINFFYMKFWIPTWICSSSLNLFMTGFTKNLFFLESINIDVHITTLNNFKNFLNCFFISLKKTSVFIIVIINAFIFFFQFNFTYKIKIKLLITIFLPILFTSFLLCCDVRVHLFEFT